MRNPAGHGAYHGAAPAKPDDRERTTGRLMPVSVATKVHAVILLATGRSRGGVSQTEDRERATGWVDAGDRG
jgi:hypothetical protein